MQPNRPDELARIQAAGGRVVFNNGHRVRGILAMSRALGPFVWVVLVGICPTSSVNVLAFRFELRFESFLNVNVE